MRIQYEGHACLRCISNNGKVLIMDPPTEKYGYAIVGRQVDYITVSHPHEDHSASNLFPQGILLPQVGSRIQAGPFAVSVMDCFHDEKQGALRGENHIYKVIVDGVTLVHLGDIGHLLDGEVLEFAKNADLLAVPVGGVFTIEPEQVMQTVKMLSPRMVLPMHYATPQCSIKQLKSLEDFLGLWDGPVYKETKTEIEPVSFMQTIRQESTAVVVLDYVSRSETEQ